MQYELLHKKPKPTDEFHCTTSVSESKRWISIAIMGLMHQLIIYIVCIVYCMYCTSSRLHLLVELALLTLSEEKHSST